MSESIQIEDRLKSFGKGELGVNLFQLLLDTLQGRRLEDQQRFHEIINNLNIDLNLKSHHAGLLVGMAEVMAQNFEGRRVTPSPAVRLKDIFQTRTAHPDILNFLALSFARQAGIDAVAVDFFGAHLLHMSHDGEEALMDPGQMFTLLEPGDLRVLYQHLTGDDRHVDESDVTVLDDRVVFVHVLRLMKNRAVKDGDDDFAMMLLERMCMILPEAQDMKLERELAAGRSGQISRAILQINDLVAQSNDPNIRQQGQAALRRLRHMLN
ncbi:MAG: transglutaminase family protein [Alphaproteobacteria bacterium]